MPSMGLAQEAIAPPGAAKTAEHLFQEHSGWIYGYCLRVLRSPEEAEDALQTTYLNACRSLNEGTRPQAGSAWLLRIAQNVCLTRLRSSGRRGKVERSQDITVLEETIAAPERPDEELMGLVAALEGLPERQRRAILLREWQGLSYREVARELGVTQASVETLIFRARRSLAAALEQQRTQPGRRLYALDFGSLLAAIKGFFAGGAGVKVAATTLAVATATTATVAATDPAGVWPGPSSPSAGEARATQSAPRPAAGSASAEARPVAQDGPTDRLPPTYRLAPAPETAAPRAERGRAFGEATAAAAKAKSNGSGKGKGRAVSQTRRALAPTSSNGNGVPATGKPDWAAQTGPPPHAETKGPAKQKSSKTSA
jgi:RNA polymerase sigma-70 factor (ECF subfamily)